MIQKPIREWDGVEFTDDEAAEWLLELDERTKSENTDYNSIDQIAEKLDDIDTEAEILTEGMDAYTHAKRVKEDGGTTADILPLDETIREQRGKASLVYMPNSQKATKAYACLPINGDGDATVSRNSIANTINKYGYLEGVSANLLRKTYKEGGLVNLLELQSTNINPYSRALTNGIYTSVGTVTDNDIIGRDGVTVNASTIEAINTDVYINASFNAASTGKWTGSVYVKGFGTAIGKEGKLLLYADTASGSTVTVLFTITDDWQLVQGTFNATSTGTVGMQVETPNISVVGEKTGLTDWQFENKEFATSSIYTNGSTVTRLSDSLLSMGDASVFNSLQGVLNIKIAALYDSLTNRGISISDGTNDNILEIFYTNVSNAIQFKFKVSGVDIVNELIYVDDITELIDIKFKYAKDDFGIKINEVEEETVSSGVVPPQGTFNTLNFKRGVSSSNFEGYVAYVIYSKSINEY